MPRVYLFAFLVAALIWCPEGALCECIKGDCLNGQGTMTYPESKNFKQYTGQFKSGKREGEGTMIGLSGDTYVGKWHNDRPDGHGILTYPDSQQFKKYNGEFKNGTKDGQGVLTFSDGRKFMGQWKTETTVKKGPAPKKFGEAATAKYLWYKRYAVGTMLFPDGKKEEGTLMENGDFIKDN